jgi:N-acetylglutamate synthase-like GNAT family acetyltransferase
MIRQANRFDEPQIIEMLKHFRDNAPIKQMKECDNTQHISTLIHHILVGRGILLVAEENNVLVGMIVGYISASLWDPKLLVLNELAFWVEPEHRGSTAGYRLLKKYNELAQELVKNKRITLYTMTKMVNSPDLDYGRFGYKKVEEHWVGGI